MSIYIIQFENEEHVLINLHKNNDYYEIL